MRMEIRDIKLNDTKLRALPDRFRSMGDALVRRTAYWIEGKAKTLCIYDTGFLRSSIYTLDSQRGGTPADAARAMARSKLEARGLPGRPFSAPPTPPKALTAYVVVGAEYGAFIEYGTIRSRAYPFLTPAFEAARPEWEEGLRKLWAEVDR